MAEEKNEEGKVVIRPDLEGYSKARSASGAMSHNNGDAVATALQGATLEEVTKLGAEVLEMSQKELREKYAHLNIGQQRMNIGNRIRGVVNKMNKAEEGSGDSYITDVSSGMREAIDKRVAKEAAAKEKAAAEAAAKAEAKAAAKDKAPAKSKGKTAAKKAA